MDIHRVRFIPYPPSTINALAFSQSAPKPSHGAGTLRLAVGRANGNIEIWNPSRGAWVHETTFSGGKDRSIEGLTWVQDPDEVDEETGFTTEGRLRLFSHGYSNAVTEWDLCRGQPLRSASGNYSDLWCFAAQPPWKPTKSKNQQSGKQDADDGSDGVFRGQNIVAGCADGTLVMLSTADEDLRFQKFLARPSNKRSRALSVTWKNRDIVVAGFADSTVGVFDVPSGTKLRNISLGRGPANGPKEILVWAVKCLPNGNVVIGDSTGEIRFYDGKTYTQLQRISSHEADILDIVVSKDGSRIFSGGMDRRTVAYELVEATGYHSKRWIVQKHDRLHQHDVKCMTAYESKKMNVIASGGLDTNLTIIPLRNFGREHHRTVCGLPQRPPLISAPSARTVLSWWDSDVRLWRMKSRDSLSTLSRSSGSKLCGKPRCLKLKGDENITVASITENGKLLAVATAAEIKLFRLEKKANNDMELPTSFYRHDGDFLTTHGARLLQLSKDGRWLGLVTPSNDVFVLRLPSQGEVSSRKGLRTIIGPTKLPRTRRLKESQNALNGSWGRYDRTITHIQFSHDSSILVTADLAGSIDSWTLQGNYKPDAAASGTTRKAERPRRAQNSSSNSPLQSSPESSDDDNDAPGGSTTHSFFGQHWTTNPSAELLPSLPSAPLLVTFRPTSRLNEMSQRDAKTLPPHDGAVHDSTSLTLPTGSRLVVLTTQHQLLEFDILVGTHSPWSRRNGPDVLAKALPAEVGRMRDRAIGALWDVGANRGDSTGWARLWLYGSSWMVMLDLEQDYYSANEASSKGGFVKGQPLLRSGEANADVDMDADKTSRKRKRETGSEISERANSPSQPFAAKERGGGHLDVLRIGTSGAGSKIIARETGTGLGKSIQKTTYDEASGMQVKESRTKFRSDESLTEMTDQPADGESGDLIGDMRRDEDAQAKGLLQFRRQEHAGASDLDDDDDDDDEGADRDADEEVGETSRRPTQRRRSEASSGVTDAVIVGSESGGQAAHKPRSWWYTYKYRPILGVVPLEPSSSSLDGRQGMEGEVQVPEVVLVERPFWDLDLPPRYMGVHERG